MTGGRATILVSLLVASSCKRAQQPGTDAAPPTDALALAAPADAASDASAIGGVYRSTNGAFRVRFPDGKPPEVEVKRIAGAEPPMHLFKVRYGTSAYIVSFDDLAKTSGRPAQESLDNARSGFVEATGGTVDSERPLVLDGYPGLELSVLATTSGIKMRQTMRAYSVDGRLYQTIVVAPEWSGATALEREFLDSFALLGDAGD